MNLSRRSFLSSSGHLVFTSLAATSISFSALLAGCQADFYRIRFRNWSREIDVSNVLASKPHDADSLLQVINGALDENLKIRPFGQMHNWSPIAINNFATSADEFLLVDMSLFDQLAMLQESPNYGVVKVGVGVLAEDLYRFLDKQKTAQGSITGYAFSNTPAPGDITVGGMMAIGGHGTGVDYQGSLESASFNGCISNMILSLTAVVWDANTRKYTLREFKRDDRETAAFLVHIGRAFIVDYTLQVVPNYSLRCLSFTDISWRKLFAPNAGDSELTVTNLLNKYGRLETIWFPYTETPWLKVWQNIPEKPQLSLATSGPYNYPFSDSIPEIASDLIALLLNAFPEKIKGFSKFQLHVIKLGLGGNLTKDSLSRAMASEGIDMESYHLHNTPTSEQSAADIWGPAYHTLLYVRKQTLRVTANGYAVIVPRSRVQEVLNRFSNKYISLLEEYNSRGLYPILGPVEYRFTGLDGVKDLHVSDAKPPALSPVVPEKYEIPENLTGGESDNIAIWLDLLTIPGASGQNEFYRDMEAWLYDNYPAAQNRVEWSKGWAYSEQGAWQDRERLRRTIPASFANGDMSFDEVKAILNKYDPERNFSTDLVGVLFS